MIKLIIFRTQLQTILRKQLQNSFLSKRHSQLLQHNQTLCYVKRQPALHSGTSVLVCATVIDCTVTWFRWEWVRNTTHHAVSQSLLNQVKVPCKCCYTGGAVFTTTRNNTLGEEWLRLWELMHYYESWGWTVVILSVKQTVNMHPLLH